MNNRFLDLAFNEAKKAYECDEVPVGAVVVCDGQIISKSHNKTVDDNIICNHAEILALIDAAKNIGDWRLNECELYVTLEPCPMCAGAILKSRIKKVYIGSESNIKSNRDIINQIFKNNEYCHCVDVEYLHDEKCSKILTSFFSKKREK